MIYRSACNRVALRLVSVMTFICVPFFAEAVEKDEIARLYSKHGIVEARLNGSDEWQGVDLNTIFKAGDAIRVGKFGRAGVLFADERLIRLNSRASIVFKRLDDTLEVKKGKVHFFSRKLLNYPKIKTPTVSASIRGTEFVIDVSEKESVISIIDGAVECSNDYGSSRASKGEKIVATKSAAPQTSLILNPHDAVQWALHYPSLLDLNDFADFVTGASDKQKQGITALKKGFLADAFNAFSGKSWRDVMGRSMVAYQKHNHAAALKITEVFILPPASGFALYLSGLHLSMGQVDEAKALLKRANKLLDQNNQEIKAKLIAGIRAQESIIALLHNKKELAHKLVQEALQHNPNSMSALLAASYVKQAHFSLREAKEHLEQAYSYDDANAFIYARLAELELSFGKVASAEKLIETALVNDPENAHAHTIAGFIALFQEEAQKAKQEFLRASQLNSQAALPHLGLGLVAVKSGDIKAGKLEFQKAVHLEPSSAIYRSYLGKAFFENEEEGRADTEYQLAIDLDPNDPTPYLYRGFSHLSQNRPVDALEDVEKSIELNDNRAVYRSSLLLDKDLGVRSAGLAKVFNDLGFYEAAKLEAIRSINRDYSNYSAHRLLADSQELIYTADAAFSERRIAELLAPLSFNLFNSIGGEASVNEYDALFDKDEIRTGTNFTYDTRDDLYATEVFHAGKKDQFGYFMSASGDFRDGSDNNDFYRDYRLRLAGQYQFNYQDRIVVEAQGQFNEADERNSDTQSTELLSYNLSLGYHRKVSPQTTFITQTLLERDDNHWRNHTLRDIEVLETSNKIEDLYELELFIDEQSYEDLFRFSHSSQVIYDSELVSTVAGYQLFYADINRDENSLIIDDNFGIFTDLDRSLWSRGNNKLNSSDFYLYSNWHLSSWADLNLGLTHTDLTIEQAEVAPFIEGTNRHHRFNPKAGFTLYPLEDLTLRFAYFETLRKASLEDQAALEPTLVGGLNQRFNDLSGTISRNLGVGVDYKLPGNTYIGSSWTIRHLIEPQAYVASNYSFDYDNLNENSSSFLVDEYRQHVDQDILSAYVYQILTKRLVASCDYQFTYQDRTDPEVDQEIQAHKVALGLKYFDPSGFFAFTRSTWRQQDRQNSFYFADGIEDFWLFDAGVGYRLAKRHGTVTLNFLNIADQNFAYDQSLGFEEFVSEDFAVRLVAALNF
jgi:Tfp pilus assembly protein PilF